MGHRRILRRGVNLRRDSHTKHIAVANAVDPHDADVIPKFQVCAPVVE